MQQPIIVITHERSGTHLLINLINFEKKGQFYAIGYTSNQNDFNIKGYSYVTYKDIMCNAYVPNSVSKSHHQVQFMEEYLDFLFSKYKVIYVKRNIHDVLTSYYKFIPSENEKNFPDIENWIFSKPDDIGREYMKPYFPDPHIINEPENYIHRWFLHTNGWLKYANRMLVIDYENILLDFKNEKEKIENYINKKITNQIPDVNDKTLPNFGPVKGIIGSHKKIMSQDLIAKINQTLLGYGS